MTTPLSQAKREVLDKLLRDDLPYIGLKTKPRKVLRYWLDDGYEARLKIHFGGFVRDACRAHCLRGPGGARAEGTGMACVSHACCVTRVSLANSSAGDT